MRSRLGPEGGRRKGTAAGLRFRVALAGMAAALATAAGATPGPASLQAQTPLRFQRMGLEAGLSQASVTALAQDSLGFLWLGTQDGLNRYDGHGFTVFRSAPGSEGGLTNSYVNDLLVDGEGRLWVATFGGLNRYHAGEDRFHHWRAEEGRPGTLPSNTVRALLEDDQGRIWAGTHGGLALLDPVTGRFRTFLTDRSPPARNVRALAQDLHGRIWVGTDGGLHILDADGAELSEATSSGAPLILLKETLLASTPIWGLHRDTAGLMWVATAAEGLVAVEPESGSVRRYRAARDPGVAGRGGGQRAVGADRGALVAGALDATSLPSNDVRMVREDRQGRLWVGTFDGLAFLDRESGRFRTFRHDPTEPGTLSQNSVWSFLEDAQGLLWFGTMTGGVNVHDPATAAFAHFRDRPGDATALPDRIVYEVRGARDGSGTLWVGTRDGGLARLHPTRGVLATYRHRPGDPRSLSSDYIVAVDTGPDGSVWVGTYEAGVNRLDPTTGVVEHFRHDPADPGSLSGDRIRDVVVDPDGSVWVATSGTGLNRIHPGTGRVTRYLWDENDPTTLSSGFARSLFLDAEGRLWVGTYGNGANLFQRETGTFRRFLHDPEDLRSLGSRFVRSIFQDRNGRIWFATDAGVSRMDGPGGTFTRYGVEDGLPSQVVYGILEADDGGLWMSTNGGVARFDPRTGAFVTFTREDGLQGDEFNTGAFWREPDGTLYFGGVNGLTAFHPQDVAVEEAPPRVVLTEFLLFNRRVGVDADGPLRAHPSVAEEIRLRPGESVFTLEFTGASYRSPQGQRFEYRLLGFDDRWIPTDAGNRRATFTALPPGSYTFQVRGAGVRGGWGEPTSVAIAVLPAFWQTLWFRALALLALMGAFVGVSYWRFQDLRLRNVLLEERVRERTAALEEKLEELRQSSLRIKRLEGLLPICAACKKVRVEEEDPRSGESWVAVESYIAARTDADFSHGICPSCVEELYPGMEAGE